jgi:hypothetical protein
MKKYIKIENDQVVEMMLEPGPGRIEFECNDPSASVYLVDGQLVEGYYNPNTYTAEEIAGFELNNRKAWAKEYLNSTDWYAARLAETGKSIPGEVLTQRQTARQLLSS